MNKQQILQEKQKMASKMLVSFMFFVFVMNAVAVIVVAPWIFIVTTAFSLAMYVVLSLTFLIFFGIPFFEFKLISVYLRGESNDRKIKESCTSNTAGKAEKGPDH